MAAEPDVALAAPSAATPSPAASRARQRRRASAIALAIGGLLFVAAATFAVAISVFDWNRARVWLSLRTAQAIGRRVEIRGDLKLSWARPSTDEIGIARYLPWPQLDAGEVALGNPDWVGVADMGTAHHLRLRLRLLPLLERRLSFSAIEIDGLDAGLVLDAQRRNNWTFEAPAREEGSAPWTVEIRRLLLRHAHVSLRDAPDRLDLDVAASSIDESPYGLRLVASGRYRDTPVSGRGRTGSLLLLTGAAQTFPFDFTLESGPIRVAATGTLTDPMPPVVFDARLTLAMQSMADVYPLTGIALPDTPPFQTSGRLVASRDNGLGHYRYEDFSGRVGGSDLSGALTFAVTKPRPILAGSVHSKVLRLADLGPAVGTGSKEAQARGGRVLPAEPLRVERLNAMDARVQFAAAQLVARPGLSADGLSTTIRLEGGVLAFDPLAFKLAGGAVSGSLALDSRDAELKARLRASLDRLEMSKLVPDVPELHRSLGVFNAQLDVSGSGNSVARLLGGADGDVQVLMNHGSFSKILLEEAGLNVGNIVLGKLFGDRQIKLNCLAADFGIERGIVDTRTFLFDTEEARVPMTGRINLRDEMLDLTLRPEQKGLRILSLRAPIYATGSFARPEVSVDKGVVAARAGGALALGLLAPVAAVLPLVAAPSADADAAVCKQALARAADAKRASGARR